MQINVKVKTNAKKNEVIKLNDVNFNVHTTATPENGKANQSVIELLAKYLHVAKSNIQIIKGITSRNKTIIIK